MATRIRSALRGIAFLSNRWLTYTDLFGWCRGISFLYGERRGKGQLIELSWSGYSHPFRLRLGGSDLGTFIGVIAKDAYLPPYQTEPIVIVDAGAHVGLSAVWFATRFPNATVFALEPDAANYALLVENTRGYSKVITRRAALWAHSGRVLFSDPRPNPKGDGYRIVGEATGEARDEHSGQAAVEAIDVTTLMLQESIEHIDLLKLDIEGAEKEVFNSSAAWIDHIDGIVIELHDRHKPGCSRAFYRATDAFSNEMTHGELVFVWR